MVYTQSNIFVCVFVFYLFIFKQTQVERIRSNIYYIRQPECLKWSTTILLLYGANGKNLNQFYSKQKENTTIRSNKNTERSLTLVVYVGLAELVAVVERAGLYSWTLGSRHEWSCAVWLGEGSDCGITEGSERKVGVSAHSCWARILSGSGLLW